MSRCVAPGLLIVVGMSAAMLACGARQPQSKSAYAEALASSQDEKSSELKRVMDRMLAPPEIRAEAGFSVRLLIAPGESPLYDPLVMRDHGDSVWIADDGGLEGDKGGQILAIARDGNVSSVMELGRLTWVHSFDVAPPSFAPYTGQIYMQSALEAGLEAQFKSHVVRRADPRAHRDEEMICVLPPAGGADGKGLSIGGGDARFGPEGSSFAGKFFAITEGNRVVYQVTPDGRCAAFALLDPRKKWGMPWGMAFTPDGQYMVVSMIQLEGGQGRATIARIGADGTVEPDSIVRSSPDKLLNLFAMAYAPPGFGEYGGEMFVAANDASWLLQYKGMSRTNTLPEAGEIYRLTRDGELKRVASGFRGAVGMHFVDDKLWVSDINGDFLLGGREIPDGFVVEITVKPENAKHRFSP